MMHWGNFSEMGYGGFGFGWIFMIFFWVLVILGIVHLMKLLFSGTNVDAGKESAEDILKKRYAAGEVSKDEYTKKLAVIKRN